MIVALTPPTSMKKKARLMAMTGQFLVAVNGGVVFPSDGGKVQCNIGKQRQLDICHGHHQLPHHLYKKKMAGAASNFMGIMYGKHRTPTFPMLPYSRRKNLKTPPMWHCRASGIVLLFYLCFYHNCSLT